MIRPNHINDVLRQLHGGCWYSYGNLENVYENIVLDSKIWDNSINDLIDNPYEIPTKEFLESELTRLQSEYDAQNYARTRATAYPSDGDFKEAYTEKEIGGDSTKWDAYVIAYNKVRTDNPK